MNAVAWRVGERVFKYLYQAEQYQSWFRHHKITPLYEEVVR